MIEEDPSDEITEKRNWQDQTNCIDRP